MQSVMTYEEWESENSYDLSRMYQLYYDEYGDAMNDFWDFKQQKYSDYLRVEQKKLDKMKMLKHYE